MHQTLQTASEVSHVHPGIQHHGGSISVLSRSHESAQFQVQLHGGGICNAGLVRN